MIHKTKLSVTLWKIDNFLKKFYLFKHLTENGLKFGLTLLRQKLTFQK